MSRAARAIGMARSVAIYHLIPWRQRRLRRLYANLVRPGDLAFDVGAHVGNRTRALSRLGCRVVAIEPQPDFARFLRLTLARADRVEVVEAAVGDHPGRSVLSISDRTPTVTTLADDWRRDRAGDPGFASVRWNRQVDVAVTTLDALIDRFGMPAFVKIDVEGHEPSVLAGLSHAVRAVSFEYLPGVQTRVETCVARLETQGRYRFNWSEGERHRFGSAQWVGGEELLARLAAGPMQTTCGDVYARL
jgi:FkbM family methyltransferase